MGGGQARRRRGGAARATVRALSMAPPLLLAACAVGPDYQRPSADIPAAWTTEQPWRPGKPADTTEKGNWWEIFGDARLNALEADVIAHNQSLQVATERLTQARAQANAASAAFFPAVTGNAGVLRERSSANRPLANYALPNKSTAQTDHGAGFGVQYEVDLFGHVRRQVEAARADAAQAMSDLANARLVLTAEMAAYYFNLCAVDSEIDVVRQNIVAQRRALDFVSSRHDMGVASGLDLAQQKSQLDTTITQIDLLRVQRAQLEHALATLSGAPAPAFTVAPQIVTMNVPAIPVGLPSDLLERRPDVASAERAMAAANARIGVARAAYFPSVPLVGAYGVDSNNIATLFNAASNLWSFGISATQPIFDAGRISANVEFAQAGYRATVAQYRQAVLTALQEVEDGMTGIGNLERASAEADAAVASAQRVVDLANDRYTGGLANYLDVVSAQQALLANERLQAQIRGQQMLVAVFLVKALGGGWQNTGQPIAAAAP